jgi:hypothetical protein
MKFIKSCIQYVPKTHCSFKQSCPIVFNQYFQNLSDIQSALLKSNLGHFGYNHKHWSDICDIIRALIQIKSNVLDYAVFQIENQGIPIIRFVQDKNVKNPLNAAIIDIADVISWSEHSNVLYSNQKILFFTICIHIIAFFIINSQLSIN